MTSKDVRLSGRTTQGIERAGFRQQGPAPMNPNDEHKLKKLASLILRNGWDNAFKAQQALRIEQDDPQNKFSVDQVALDVIQENERILALQQFPFVLEEMAKNLNGPESKEAIEEALVLRDYLSKTGAPLVSPEKIHPNQQINQLNLVRKEAKKKYEDSLEVFAERVRKKYPDLMTEGEQRALILTQKLEKLAEILPLIETCQTKINTSKTYSQLVKHTNERERLIQSKKQAVDAVVTDYDTLGMETKLYFSRYSLEEQLKLLKAPENTSKSYKEAIKIVEREYLYT